MPACLVVVPNTRAPDPAPHTIGLAALADRSAAGGTRLHRESRLDQGHGLGLEELLDAAPVSARVPRMLAEGGGVLAELDGDPREQDDHREERRRKAEEEHGQRIVSGLGRRVPAERLGGPEAGNARRPRERPCLDADDRPEEHA